MLLRSYNGRRVSVKSTGVPFLILALRRVLVCAPFAPSIRTSAELAADFYPTVKAALRHESADSEEDLGCHMGQARSMFKKVWPTISGQNSKCRLMHTNG